MFIRTCKNWHSLFAREVELSINFHKCRQLLLMYIVIPA